MTTSTWRRTAIEHYGKVEPVADAWSLVTAEGVLLARIWLERNPKDPWRGKWVVMGFYNKRGVEQGFTGAYATGAEARVAAERWTGSTPQSPIPQSSES